MDVAMEGTEQRAAAHVFSWAEVERILPSHAASPRPNEAVTARTMAG